MPTTSTFGCCITLIKLECAARSIECAAHSGPLRDRSIKSATKSPEFASPQKEIALKILLNESQIGQGIDRLAMQLKAEYADRPLTIVAILTGSLVMLADLIRRLEMPVRISLIQASSYRGGMKSGELTVQDHMMLDIRNREVLLIDDIFDTGRTLVHVTQLLEELGPASVKTAVFLNKLGQSMVSAKPDYVVFEIPNEFVVGYGLDYLDLYRNLPFVGVLEESDLQKHANIEH